MADINPIAAIVQPSALKPRVFVGLASGLCTLTASVIALRLWTNFNHLRKLHSDDYLSVLALLFLIWNSVTFSLLMRVLNSNPNDVTIEHLTRLVAVGIASGNGAIYSAKLPLLYMLMRTFGVKNWFRWTCLFLIIFGTLGGVITLLFASISCSPDLHKPTPLFLVSCVTNLTNATIARGSLSLAIDVITFIIPIPIIVNLSMSLRRKIGLVITFATGLLAIAASALGLYFQAVQSQESSTNFANALLVTVIESAIVTMVSCTPGIHLFWNKHAGFLHTRLSLRTLGSSHPKSKISESNLDPILRGTNNSKSDRVLVQSHHYIELEEYTNVGKALYEVRVSSNNFTADTGLIYQEKTEASLYSQNHQFVHQSQRNTAATKPTIPAAPAPAPALMNQGINGSYISEATRQLTRLSEAVGQDEVTLEKLLRAFKFSGGEWCQNAVPQKLDRSGWVSDVSNDHSPFEYSFSLSQETGASELRFLIEAQPVGNSLAALQESTSRLTDEIATEYGPTKVSLDRLNLVRDLFLPSDAEGKLASWHSFAVSKRLEKWKIYLNPLASGRQNAFNVTREALERLGLASSWRLLESMMTGDDYPIYFSLGLSPNPEEAEVKVYVAHCGASATQIAQKHVKMDPNSSVQAIELFYSAMAGGSLGPYRGKPGLSCFHFKNKDPSRPAARTVLYPMDSYVANDAEAQERIETYMDAISAPQLYRERYRNAIRSVQRRALEAGCGIHSWVSMKEKLDGKRSNTFYLSAELYRCSI